MDHQLAEGLAEILEVDVDTLTPDFSLTQANWDSLAIVSTIALVDDTHGLMLNGMKLSKCSSLADVLALIEKAKEGK
jgi:acyl carrier protein